MRKIFAVLVIVLAGLAYLAGYWPESRQRQALEGQLVSLQANLAATRADLAAAQARVRLGGLLGQLLAAQDAVSLQNYGQAQTLSSEFFDAVRAEATRSTAGSFKDPLEKIRGMRDTVTASLTRADPQSLTLLREAETLLRDTLGFPRPVAP